MEVLSKIFADLCISSRKQDKGNYHEKVLGRSYIKILQNATIGDRSLSGKAGNGFIVPKGDTWPESQVLKMYRAKERGSVQLTQMSAEC